MATERIKKNGGGESEGQRGRVAPKADRSWDSRGILARKRRRPIYFVAKA